MTNDTDKGWETGGDSASPDSLRERYVERTLEKILRYQREPPLRAADYIIALLLVITLLAVFLKPAGHATVDLTATQKSLDEIKTRMDDLAKQQAAMQKEIAAFKSHAVKPVKAVTPPSFKDVSPSPTASVGTPSPIASAAPSPSPSVLALHPSPSPSVIKSPQASPSVIKSPLASPSVIKATPSPSASPEAAADGTDTLHVLQPGESLWSICQKEYGDARYLNALARYNGIDNPGRMHVGAQIKLPPLSKLTHGHHSSVSTTGTGRD